ncbi:hypothetical protein [Halobellus limi]|uniref:Uncharacterized protein n=1 Tax=Halobellus limi TaxID=699433 RepID=A0A1H5ZHT7_9EURY|nr:hypothetical protein [Halobellus limi]QCC48093.1 hypothetical protein DV707_10715 [Halobellus limi]SEG35802.1 hypothetical protein SAMN04488133_2002 [Halobellus limi]
MKKISIDTPVEDMDEESLRATFTDVLAAHEENVTEFETETTKFSELESELEAEREKTAEVSAYFAEKATAVTSLDTDLLVDRFSLEELMGMAARADEEAAAAAASASESESEFDDGEEADVDGGDDADEDVTIFAERRDRAPITDEEQAAFTDEARSRLSRIPGLTFD